MMENVQSMVADPSNQWALLVQSPDGAESCEAYVCKDDELELAGSKGTAHFIKKWEGAKHQVVLVAQSHLACFGSAC